VTHHEETGHKDDIRKIVREGYAKVAMRGSSCCGSDVSPCCGPTPSETLARSIGYSEEDLSGLPSGANMGLSCGNPTALASLRPGETVLDLGSGGGFDVFIAARKVGPTGRAIGVDMTPEMVTKARRNAARFTKETGLDNVEFRLGEIEHLPVADNTIDAVISNCVINLSPDKDQVWRDVARVLKPGGRVAVSDLALLQPLPQPLLDSVAALVGCVAGAVLVDETVAMVKDAGLRDIVLTKNPSYVEGTTDWNDPTYRTIVDQLPEERKLTDYVVSLDVSARKPGEEDSRRPDEQEPKDV
jgi:SAM-dependent methyltransferase